MTSLCRPETAFVGPPRSFLTRPSVLAECSQPCGPGEVDELARAQSGREALACLVVEELPAGVAQWRLLAEQMVHAAPLRLPMPSEESA